MGLDSLRRNAGAITAWALIVTIVAGIVIAIYGGIIGSTAVASNAGTASFAAALVGGILYGGYALGRHTDDDARLNRIEESIDDVRRRVRHIESEQLEGVADSLRAVEQALGGDKDANDVVRQLRRGN